MEGAVRLLVTRFIPLTPTDLEKWEMDVEEWMNQEENDDEQWEYELRVCVFYPRLPFAPDCFFYVAMCRTGTVNVVVAVQTVCSSYPTSLFRQRCGYVSPCLTSRFQLTNSQLSRPWSYPTLLSRKPFTAPSVDARTH